MKRTASAGNGSRLKSTWKRPSRGKRFVVCVRNKGAEDLVLHKIYLVLPDPIAALDDYLRIVDESGEDYLYPANYFIAIQLPMPVKRALRAVPA